MVIVQSDWWTLLKRDSNKPVSASSTNRLTPKKSSIDSHFCYFFFHAISSPIFSFPFRFKLKRHQQPQQQTLAAHKEGDHDKNNWWFHLLAQLFRKFHYSRTLNLFSCWFIVIPLARTYLSRSEILKKPRHDVAWSVSHPCPHHNN